MTFRLELEKINGRERIALRFPYDEESVVQAKQVSGARYSRPSSCWHYPLTMTNCKLLREQFPDLTIGPKLTKWAFREKRNLRSLMDFHIGSSAEPVDLPLVRTQAPTIWAAMQGRGYQTVVPAFAKAVGSYFNGSQPGCGKTIETLGSLIECEIGQMILVVAPLKPLRLVWEPEIKKWLEPDFLVNANVIDEETGTIPEREERLLGLLRPKSIEFRKSLDCRFTFVMINPEMLRWKFTCAKDKCRGVGRCDRSKTHTKTPQHPSLFGIKWDAIILDETHKMMMNANERSGSVSGWGYGVQQLKLAEKGIKIGMSGTPFKGKVRRFWPVLHWLRPKEYTGQGKWTEQYFEMARDRYAFSGWKPTEKLRPDREQLFYDDLSRIMIRHTKRELRKINPAWAPPDKIHIDVLLPMYGAQKKAYSEMELDAETEIRKGTLTANGILAERTRLRQFANTYGRMISGNPDPTFLPALPSNKFDWIVGALEERGLDRGMNDGDVKVGIISSSVKTIELFSKLLTAKGISNFVITGSSKGNEKIVKQWQSNQTHTRVLFISTKSGTGLTLDAADDVIEIDESENPDDQEQAEDRFHRTSRTDHQVTIWHLRSEKTIDIEIGRKNLTLDKGQKNILDGRRGHGYRRKVPSKKVVADTESIV